VLASGFWHRDLLIKHKESESMSIEAQAPILGLSLTEAAATHLRRLLAEKNLPRHGLRLFVKGGGCSGLEYGMILESEASASDTVVESHGIQLFVDPQSLPHLAGSQIHYLDTLMGGGFQIENPNAVSSCGCGTSFRTATSQSSGGGCGHQ
jgi:iron-sulfur cluster assembly protein